MRKKILLIILIVMIFILLYKGYTYYNIMLKIDFNKDIYYADEWKEDNMNFKYYGVNYKKFDIDKFIEEYNLMHSYEFNLDNNIKTPKDVAEVLLSIGDHKYKTGFDIYYELNSNRWAIVPVYRSDIEYICDTINIFVIHNNTFTYYVDRIR